MINRALNFSMADRINAAKTSTTGINDNAAPKSVNAKPGNSNINANTNDIDQAGKNVQSKSTEGTNATNNANINQKLGDASNITYEKQQDTEFPKESDPGKQPPTPKNKSFSEALLDKQMASRLNSNKPDTKTSESVYPQKQTEGINRPQPDDTTPSRPQPRPFDPQGIDQGRSQAPSGDVLGNIPGGRPAVNLGPNWTKSAPSSFKPSSLPKPKFK